MTHVTCRLTAKNRHQLRNLTLGNRVWATFTLPYVRSEALRFQPVCPCVRACGRAGEGNVHRVAVQVSR